MGFDVARGATRARGAVRGDSDRIAARGMLKLWRRIGQEFALHGQKHWEVPLNAGIVLMHLGLYPDDDEPALLAQVTCFPRQTMTYVLDTLEKRGLAWCEPHPSDRRRKRVILTETGRKLSRKMLDEMLVFEEAALAAIPGPEIETFKHLVNCYADALARQNAARGSA